MESLSFSVDSQLLLLFVRSAGVMFVQLGMVGRVSQIIVWRVNSKLCIYLSRIDDISYKRYQATVAMDNIINFIFQINRYVSIAEGDCKKIFFSTSLNVSHSKAFKF